METVTLKISGMACGGCAASVKAALEAVKGVLSAEVSLETARAVVAFDPGLVAGETLCAAIAAAGYHAETA